jgi:hypothetical protein
MRTPLKGTEVENLQRFGYGEGQFRVYRDWSHAQLVVMPLASVSWKQL